MTQTPKRSPSLQQADGTIHSSTANAYEHLLLQPKQTAGLLHGLFPEEESKPPVKDDDKKIKALSQRLARVGITNFKEPDIGFVLNAAYAKGDSEKAFDLLVLLEESEEGIIKEYDPSVKLLGAINREGVSCYLDSVLFAMFARLGSFEAILFNNFEDEPRKRLATLLRLWVNTLRVGKLITTDITKQLQERLSDCGWKEAATLTQQDASEAFSFITETLALPLLTLKMDIFHTGKEEATDDHKFVNERLLEVAVPEELADGRIITLEECLETYFNNRIEVRRYLERRNTTKSVQSGWSVESNKGSTSHVETVELGESHLAYPSSPEMPSAIAIKSSTRPTTGRQRAPSIIQDRFLSEKHASLGFSSIEEEAGPPGRPRAGSLRQVMMPAFQFFSLLPWYTDNKPSSDAQVAAHFSSTRPILGICLKRYSFLANGRAVRRNTHIDIPLEIGLPHFIQDDAMSEDGPAFGNFKLSLQSAVCHRGNSVNSGHYVSLVRSHEQEPDLLSGESGSQWMRLDDLAKERVAFVDVQDFLQKESPYLLFYQVQPIDGDPGNIADTWRPVDVEGPPSYAVSESRDSAVADLSLSFNESLNSNGDSMDLTRPRREATNPRDQEERSSMTKERRSIYLTGAAVENARTPSVQLTNDPNFLVAFPEDSKPSQSNSRGRPTSGQSQHKRSMSRSLSRLAGKLAKDRLLDGPAITPVDAAEMTNGTSQQPPHTVPTTASSEPQRLKKENDSREKHSKRNDGHSGHLVKGKQKSEKPDRECSIM
ncbi:hypothetical protein MMC07_006271 [Pseudocyphellaria aurata]|nr:hypothetical protein [Pseudocyphellaria aurata]